MHRLARAVALQVVLAGAFPAIALAADGAIRAQVPTVTRLVKLFSEQEAKLAAALQGGDAAAAGAMLEEDFELRAGRMPGNPTPREEWLRLSLGKPAAYGIEQMAVHDYDTVAVVSFLQAAATRDARGHHADLFTIDVWKRSGRDWKLAVRYAAPAGGADVAIPGASTEAPIPKKY